MSLIGPDPSRGLPRAGLRSGSKGNRQFDKCTCDCHRIAGVKHIMPCCYPNVGNGLYEDDPLEIRDVDDVPSYLPERN